ncbi:MAG: outer membrane lipoprotein carrier protein LolA [bacterium]|nr:MAG: outer membrane lipoprotein carrier protein LolA [bacterium]
MIRLLALMTVLLCAWPLRASDVPDDAARAMALVRETYGTLTAIRADFVQTEERPGVGVSLREEGVLSFLLPDMMRWDYGGEKPHRVVIDGDLVWIYTPSRKQVVRRRMTPEEMRQGAATFLRGMDGLERDFSVRSAGGNEEHRYLLDLYPRSDTTPYERIRVAVNKETGIIERIGIHHRIGNVTTITFTDIETEVSLPRSLFAWDIPDGVEVIEP